MEQQVINGIEFQDLGPCRECGRSPTELDLRQLVLDYTDAGNICSICGKPIRLIRIDPKHIHAPGDPADLHWDVKFLGFEKSFNWMTHCREFTVDINAHLECSMLTMPFADWKDTDLVRLKPAGRMVENLEVESPCPRCGKEITPEEHQVALDWLFRILDCPCVYCGREIRLLWAKIHHRTWRAEDLCLRWGVEDWRKDRMASWCGMVMCPGGGFQSINFLGHYDCALRHLPHAYWNPPLPRAPWRKQDWSLRIEPWQKGHIPGEAVPDWGIAYNAVRRSQSAGKAT